MANTKKSNIEEIMEQPASLKQLIVATAIASIDFSRYDSYSDMLLAVCKRTDTVSDLIRDTSVPIRMTGAVRIAAKIKEVKFEESSQRYTITYTSDKPNADGEFAPEHIRSDRTDGRFGDAVKRLWSGVNPGDHVIIYKVMEETNNPKKPQVRVAPYVKKIK